MLKANSSLRISADEALKLDWFTHGRKERRLKIAIKKCFVWNESMTADSSGFEGEDDVLSNVVANMSKISNGPQQKDTINVQGKLQQKNGTDKRANFKPMFNMVNSNKKHRDSIMSNNSNARVSGNRNSSDHGSHSN
jgi:hypothetical protein